VTVTCVGWVVGWLIAVDIFCMWRLLKSYD